MFQPLSLATLDNFGDDPLSSLQSRVASQASNLVETNTLIAGEIYIYDLVEQRNLIGSCSIASLLGYGTHDVTVIEPLGLAGLIHPDDLSRVVEHFQRFNTLHYDEVVSIEYRVKRADGQWCWLRSQETPLVQADDGFPLQILGIIQVLEQEPVLAIASEQCLLNEPTHLSTILRAIMFSFYSANQES